MSMVPATTPGHRTNTDPGITQESPELNRILASGLALASVPDPSPGLV